MMDHLQEESNCSMSVGLDLYSDILTEDVKHREHTLDELQNKFEEAQKKIAILENELANQQRLVHEYLKKNCTLQSNISSLFITARRELHRKDSEIRELRNSTPQRHWNGTNPPVKQFSVCGGKGARLTQDSETNAAIFSSQANKPQAFDDKKSPISNRLRVLSQEVCKADLSSSPFSRENRPCRRENRSKDSGKHHSRDRTLTTDECNEVDDSSSSGRLKSRVKRKLSDEDIQDRSKRFRHESSRDAKYDCARKLVERSKKDITRRRESVERSLSCIRIADVENKHKTRNSDTDSNRYYLRNKDRISDGDNKIRSDESKCSKIQSRRKLDSSPERGPSVYIDLREKLRSSRQQKGSEVENTDRDTSKKLVQTPDKYLRGRSQKNDANELAKTDKTVVEESKLSGDFVTVKRKYRYEDDHSLRTTRNFNSSKLDTEELIDYSEQDDDSVKVSATCKEYYGKRLTDNFLSSQFENANKLIFSNNACQRVLNKQLVHVRKGFADGTACEKHIIHQKEKSFPDIHEDAQNLKGTEVHGLKMLQLEYNPSLEPIRENLQEACFISDRVSTVNTDVVIGEEYNTVKPLLAMQSVNDRVIVITSHEINKTSDKENKDTTDFSMENECITYSNKENKNTNYLDKENKGTTDFSKENDTTYSNKENKDATDSAKKNMDTTYFSIYNKDIYSNTENKDITYSDKENMDTTDFGKDNRDTNSNTEIKDTTDSAKEDKDTADLSKENKDTTDSSKNKDTTYSYKENKDTTYSCNVNKDITDSYKGSKDTTDLNKNKGTTDSNLENKSITYSGKEKICNTGSLEQNKEKSDSGRKNKDKTYRENLTKTDSDKYHKNKAGLNNDKQNHPVRKPCAKEVSRNEQQSHKKDQREKQLNNKEHNQDREQVSTSTATKEKASIAEWRVKKLADAKSNNAAKLDHSEQTCGSSKEQYPTLEHCQDAAIECQHDCEKPMHNVSSKIDKVSRGRHLDKVVFPAVREVTSFDSKNLSNKDSSSGKETLYKKKKKNIVQELEKRTSTRKKPAATVVNFMVNSADVNVECKERKLSKDRTSSPDNRAESVQRRKSVRNKEKCFDPQGKEIKELDITEKSTHNNGKEEKGENRCNNKEKGSKSLNTYLHCSRGGESVQKKQANKINLKDDKDVIFTLEDSLFNGNSNPAACSKERNLVENSALLHSPFKDMASADNSVLSDTAKITETISTLSSDINQTEVLEESAVNKSKSNNGYTSLVLSESDKTDRILTGGSMPAIWGSQRCFVTSETEYEFDSDNQSPNHGTYTYSPVSMYNRQLSVNRSGTTTRSLISSKPSSFAKICSSETDVGKSDMTDSGQSGDKSEMNSQVILTTKENSQSVDLIDYVSKQIEVEISKSPDVLLPILPLQRKQIRIDSAKRPELPRKVKKPGSNKTSKYDEVVFDHTAVGNMEGYFPKNSSDSEKNDETSEEEEKPNTKDASGKPCEKFPEQTWSTNDGKRLFDNSTDNQNSINKSTTKTCTNTSTVMSLEKSAAKATESESLPHKSFDCKRKHMEGTQNCLPLESNTPQIQSSLELEKINVKAKKCEKPKKSGRFQILPVINSHSADTSMESPLLAVSRTSNISRTSNRSGLLRDLLGEVSQEIIYLESKKKAWKKMMKKSKEETRSDYLLSDGKIDKSSSSLNSSCDLRCYSASTSLDEPHSPDKSSGTKCILEPNESISRMSGLTFLFEDLDDRSNINKTTSHEQFQLKKKVDFDVISVKVENTKKDSSPMISSLQPEKGSCSETIRRDFETCLFGNVSSSSEDSQFSQLTDMKYEQEDEESTKADTNAVGVNNAKISDVNSLYQCNLDISSSKFSSEEKNMIMSTSREDSSFDIYASISNTSVSLLKGNSYIIEDEMLTFDIPDQSQSHAATHTFSDGLEGDKSTAVDLPLIEQDSASQIRDDSPVKRSVSLEEHLMEASMEESPVKGCSILTNMVPVLQQNADGSHGNNTVTDVERKIMLTPSPVKEHKSGAFHHQLVTEDLSTKSEKASFSPRRQQKLNDNKNQTTEYPFLRTVSSQGVNPGKPFAQSSEKQCNLLSMKSPLKPDNYSLDCLHGVASPLKPKSPVVESIVVKNYNVLPVLGSAQQIAEYENSGNVILHSHIDIISPGKLSSANCNFSMERMNTSSNDKSISGHIGINIHFDVRSEDKVVMPGNSQVQHSQTYGAVVPSSIIGDISSLSEKSTCTGKSREFVKSATGEKFSKNGHPVITRKSHLRHNPSPSKSVTSLIETISNTSFKPGTPRGFDSEITKAESSRTMETKNVIVLDVLHMHKNHSPVKVCHMSFQNKEMIESTQCPLVNNSENKTVPNMSSPKKKSKKSNRKQSSVENDIEKMEQSCRKERHTKSNAFSSRSLEEKMSSADKLECTQNLRHSLDNPAKSFPQCLMNNVSDICESQVEVYTENTLKSRSKTLNSESKTKGEKCTMENRSKGPEKTNAEISAQIPCTSSLQRKRKESVLIFGNELSLHASEESLLNLVDPEIETIHHKRDSKTRLLKQADKGPITESIPDPVSPKRPTVRDKKYSKVEVDSSKASPEKENNLGKTSIKNRKSNSKKDSKLSLTSPWKELRSSPRRSQINLSPQPCRDQVVQTSSARKRILPSPDKCYNSKRAKISPKNKDTSSDKKADNTIANISLEKKSNLPKNTSCAKMLKISPQSGNMGNNLEASGRFSDGRSKFSSYKKSCKSSTSLTAGMQCWTSPRIKKTKLLDEVFKSENSRSPKKNLPPNRKNEKVMENDEFCAAQDHDGKNRTRSGLQKSSSKKKLILKGFAELTKKDKSPQPKRVIPVPVVTESVLTDTSHQISVFANLEQMKSAESMPRKINIPVTIKDDKNSEMEDQITASQMQQIPSSTVQEHQKLLEPVKKKNKLERCSVMVCNIITQEAETEYTNHESSLAKNTMYVEINYDDAAEKLDKIVLHTETDSKYNEKQLETPSRAKKIESSKERTVDSVRKRHIGPYSMNRVEKYVYVDNEFGKEIDGDKVSQREEKLVHGQDERTDVEDDWDYIGEDHIKKDIETDENNSLDSCAEESNYYYNDFYKNKVTERVNSGERKECFDDPYDDDLDDLEEGEISLDSEETLHETLQPGNDADGSDTTSEERVPWKTQATHQNSVSKGDLAREDRERKKLVHRTLFSNKDSYQRSKQERKDDHSNRKQESNILDKRLKSSLRLTKSQRTNSQRRSKSRSPKPRSSLSKLKSPLNGKKYLQRRSRSRSRTPQQRLSLSSKYKSRSSEVLDRHSLSSGSRSKDRHRSRERCMFGSQKEHISPRFKSRRQRSREFPQHRVLTPERRTPWWKKSKEMLTSRGKSPVRVSWSGQKKLSPHEHSRRACKPRRR